MLCFDSLCAYLRHTKDFIVSPKRVHNTLHFQLLDRIEMGTFVWWEGPAIGREEWRCSGLEHGELSVTLNGAQQMLMSCVNS